MQIIVFNLGNEKIALETKCVYGIERLMDFLKVTLLPTHITGLVNVSGDIITGIDLKAYFNMKMYKKEEIIIIAEIENKKIGIIVDNVVEVIEADNINIQKLNNCSKKLKGTIEVGEYKVNLLDEELLLENEKMPVTWLSTIA